jgi:hypothetical protein
MNVLGLCLLVQLCLGFGVAGLFWPEKVRPVFDVLMFPWPATNRTLRLNCVAAIAVSILLLARLLSALG